MIPEPPEELLLYGDGEYDIDYESPLALAQKAQQGLSVLRTWEAIQPMAALDPSILDKFDLDACVDVIAESNGMLEKCKNSKDTIKEIRDQRTAQQSIAAGLDAAGQGGAALKDISQAAHTMRDDRAA
jgi:hypothetical protein